MNFSEKMILKKKQQTTKKHDKLPRMQRVKVKYMILYFLSQMIDDVADKKTVPYIVQFKHDL